MIGRAWRAGLAWLTAPTPLTRRFVVILTVIGLAAFMPMLTGVLLLVDRYRARALPLLAVVVLAAGYGWVLLWRRGPGRPS